MYSTVQFSTVQYSTYTDKAVWLDHRTCGLASGASLGDPCRQRFLNYFTCVIYYVTYTYLVKLYLTLHPRTLAHVNNLETFLSKFIIHTRIHILHFVYQEIRI